MNASELSERYCENPRPRFSNEELTRRIQTLEQIVDILMQHLRVDLIAEVSTKYSEKLILNPNSEEICRQRDCIARGEDPFKASEVK